METLLDLISGFGKRKALAMKYKTDYRTFSYSYFDLYEAVNRCANYLRAERMVGKGDKVAIWGPNSPDWVIAFFGIIAAGGVVVPIDNKATAENAAKIIVNAGAGLAIKSKRRPGLAVSGIFLEDLAFLTKGQPRVTDYAPAHKDDLVELVYTSGTTGDPKGVMITHENLLSNIEAVIRHIDVNARDQMISVLPLSHLFEQTCNMLAELYIGASIVYLETLKPSLIFRALAEERITLFIAVPRLLQGFKNAIREKFDTPAKRPVLAALFYLADRLPGRRKMIFFFIHKKFGKNFRFFVSGGASLDRDTESFWNRLGFTVVQGYGLTECSPILTANQEKKLKPGSVGLPLDNVELALNEEKEIIARGPNIFKGYYRDEAKTAAAFRAGWFLTGDIGYRDPDGFYYVKGRKKDVIVTAAGVNVHPEDIEFLLNARPEIKESCVIGVTAGGNETVHAVLIPDERAGRIKADEIIDQVNNKLDSSQKITGYTIWKNTEFPKTTTLKVKKNLVKENIGAALGVSGTREDKDDRIAGIISDITGRPVREISGNRRLTTDLKLDSIGRVELIALLEQEFNIDFEEELVTPKTTVNDLRAMINEKKRLAAAYKPSYWPFYKPVEIIRNILMDLVGLNIARIWCRTEAYGLGNLEKLDGPAIFAPNHVSYFDQGAVLAALPKRIRHKIATAAWAEFFRPSKKKIHVWLFRRLCFYLSSLIFGVVPLSKEKNIKKNLQFIGALADRGRHIMIFPEGERTMSDKMLALKPGVAVLARELAMPIVPVGISGTEKVLPRKKAVPRRHQVKVSFGKPWFSQNKTNYEILGVLASEIEKLRQTNSI